MTYIPLILPIVELFACIFLLLKNNNTYKKHKIIIAAINKCSHNNIDNGSYIGPWVYGTIENYEKTLFRIWDWGYTKIVPPDVLEKIAPFIEED